MPDQPSLQLSLIGGFDLRHRGRPITTRESGARLLAALAVTGRHRPASRAILGERLWADDDSVRAAGRLRSVLWRLPRVGGEALVVGGCGALRLADHVEVDLWSAEGSANRPASDVGSVDLSCFMHDLLPDWPEDWLVAEREAFRQTRLHALERASEHLSRHGSHAAALQAALAAVACEPLRETAHRRVIEAHLAEGNHAEALRQYQAYRRLLALELGLVPTPAIRGLVAPLLGRPADHRPGRGSR